jgi:DNA-binding CsgD family transcriptional regulator
MSSVMPVSLLERAREQKHLEDVLRAAVAGAGSCTIIEGPPGIGKSALLEFARAVAADAGMTILGARAGELERDYPFDTAIRLLEPRFRRADASERQHLLRGRANLARPLIEGPAEVPGDEYSLIHGLYWTMVNLSDEKPLALLLDDAHWADQHSLSFVAYLGRRLEDLPIALIIASRRPEGDDEARLLSIVADRDTTVLRPELLSDVAVRRILSDVATELGERDDMVHAAWENTGGNPFLIHELASALHRSPQAWSRADASDLAAFAPEAVAEHVLRRLNRLGPDALNLARSCAVLGRGGSTETALRLADIEPEIRHLAVQRLVARGILADPERVEFTHPVIRSAVYDATPVSLREGLHLKAARHLHRMGGSDADIAAHLLVATPVDESWCQGALRGAARSALSKGAPDAAVRYLRRALQFAPDEPRDPILLVDLGLAEAAAGQTTSLRRFEEALQGVGGDETQARTYYAMGQTLHRYGRHGEAVEVFERGAARFESDPRWRLLFEGGVGCAANYVADGRSSAIPRLEAVAEPLLGRPGPGDEGERAVLAALALQRSLVSTDLEAAETFAIQVVSSAPLQGRDRDDIAIPQAVAALVFCGNATAAEAAVLQIVGTAQANGAALAFAEAKWLHALVLHNLGRVEEARAAATESIEMTSAGWLSAVPAPHAYLTDCLIETGELDAAQALLESGELSPARPEASGLNAWFHWARGRLRMARRDPSGALDDFLSAGRAIEPFAVVNPAVLHWRSQAAGAAHALGNDSLAHQLVDEEIELARACARPGALGVALGAKALMVPNAAAVGFIDESLECLRRSDRQLELARVLLIHGRSIRLAGRMVEARESLREALDLADRCHASVLAQHIRRELLATGAKPRRAAITGRGALTASEERIALLAAGGMTNREIAEELFLTRNTVETHLRHAYRKLQITSREHLPGALAEE